MSLTHFQKLATAALVSVLILIFVGAIVRVSGSGMGCPDWPTCWGCLIPPTSVDDVDLDRLPIERFRNKAERMGRDPNSITVESLRNEFNPRHVWTEFINRLCSLPVGFFCLATFIASFWQRGRRPLVFWMAFASLVVVLVNAWMGARVVYSGLKPGVLTAHLALAMMLTGMLAYCAWRGTEQPWRIQMNESARQRTRLAVGTLARQLHCHRNSRFTGPRNDRPPRKIPRERAARNLDIRAGAIVDLPHAPEFFMGNPRTGPLVLAAQPKTQPDRMRMG